jgi:hypothetical protein
MIGLVEKTSHRMTFLAKCNKYCFNMQCLHIFVIIFIESFFNKLKNIQLGGDLIQQIAF